LREELFPKGEFWRRVAW